MLLAFIFNECVGTLWLAMYLEVRGLEEQQIEGSQTLARGGRATSTRPLA